MQEHDKDDAISEPMAYSPEGASQTSTLSLREIMKAIRAGHLRSFKKGRRRIIFRKDLEAYLKGK